MVGEEGVEPSRPKGHRILSPARLPVPPLAPQYTPDIHAGITAAYKHRLSYHS